LLPQSFFDTQPTGRLLNRFTKDTEAVDVQLSNSFSSFAICFVNVWFSLAVVIVVTPAFAVMIIPIAIIYWCASSTKASQIKQIQRNKCSVTKFYNLLNYNFLCRGQASARSLHFHEPRAQASRQRCLQPYI
jgi:ABC-type multidrug transport system fused ATPase/permease subunit